MRVKFKTNEGVDHRMLTIARGTTPTIRCEIPEKVNISEATEIWIVVANSGIPLITKTLSNSDFTIEGQYIFFRFTQEETLLLGDRGKTQIGVRILMQNNIAYSSDLDCESVVKVENTIKEGVMSWTNDLSQYYGD